MGCLSAFYCSYFKRAGQRALDKAAEASKPPCKLFTYERIGGEGFGLSEMSPVEAFRHQRSQELLPLHPRLISLPNFLDIMPPRLTGSDENRALYADHRTMKVVLQKL